MPPSPIGVNIQGKTPQQEAAPKKQEEQKSAGANPSAGYNEASRRAERAARAERDPADKIIQEQVQKAKDTPGAQSSTIRIDRTTGEVRIKETSRDIRSNVPQRTYTTTYENPQFNQVFGNKRTGDILRKEAAQDNAALTRAGSIPEFGDVLKSQTTRRVITNEAAKDFARQYSDYQLDEIRSRKGAADFGVAVPKKGGTVIEEMTSSGEIIARPAPKLIKSYHVNIGNNEKLAYGAQPDIEKPQGGFGEGFYNYFENIPRGVQKMGEEIAYGRSNVTLKPEPEGQAFSALIGAGYRAVRGTPADVNLLLFTKEIGDVGRQIEKNPLYAAGSLAGSAIFTVGTLGFGKGITLAKSGAGAAARGIQRIGDVGKIGLDTTTFRFTYSPAERGFFGRYLLGKPRFVTKYANQGRAPTANFRLARTEEYKISYDIPDIYPTKDVVKAGKGTDDFRPFTSDDMIKPISGGRQAQVVTSKQGARQVEKSAEQELAKALKEATAPVAPKITIKTEVKEIRELVKAETTPSRGLGGGRNIFRSSVVLGLGGLTGAERKRRVIDETSTFLSYPPESITKLEKSSRLAENTMRDVRGEYASILGTRYAPKMSPIGRTGLRQSGSLRNDLIDLTGLRADSILDIGQVQRQSLKQLSILETDLVTDLVFEPPRNVPDTPPTTRPPRGGGGMFNYTPDDEKPRRGKKGKKARYRKATFSTADLIRDIGYGKQGSRSFQSRFGKY